MKLFGREIPDWAVYAGGGIAVGGAYFFYKKRKASQTAAALSGSTSTTGTTADTSNLAGSQYQQPSIVPYYLTDQSGLTQSGTSPTMPGPVPASTGSQLITGGDLGTIPPILPPVATTPTTPVAPVVTPPPAPAPPPAPLNNNIPPDLLAKITANGEKIVSSVAAPSGGVWYLGSKGGVFAINAPYYGGPAGQSYWGSRTGLQIVPNGQGYTVIDTAGERYNYLP